MPNVIRIRAPVRADGVTQRTRGALGDKIAGREAEGNP